MDEKDLAKEVLIEVAKDLSKIFEQPIEMADNKTDVDLLKKNLIEAGNELQEGDSLTDESKDVLIALGVKLPWPIESKKETAKPVEPKKTAQKAKAKSAGKKKTANKKEKEKSISEKKTVGKKAEKIKPIEKEAKKTVKKGVGAFVNAGLIDGTFKDMANKEIAKLAIEKFKGNTKASCIGWYKNQLKKKGIKFIV